MTTKLTFDFDLVSFGQDGLRMTNKALDIKASTWGPKTSPENMARMLPKLVAARYILDGKKIGDVSVDVLDPMLPAKIQPGETPLNTLRCVVTPA